MNIREQIIELIPSVDLKNAIKDSDFELSETDLFRIIEECSPTFEKRIEYLELLRANSSKETADYAKRNIEYNKALLAEFTKCNDNTVFELSVNERERYVFKNLEAAMEFTKIYPNSANPSGAKKYYIKKMLLRDVGMLDADEYEDTDFCVVVNGEIREIWCEYIELSPVCDGKCLNCERFCHIKEDSKFPNYIDMGDLIRYPDDFGLNKYAIVLTQPEETFDYVFCVPLDSAVVRCRAFDKAFYAHNHPSPYYVEKAKTTELDDATRGNYLAYREYLGLDTDN